MIVIKSLVLTILLANLFTGCGLYRKVFDKKVNTNSGQPSDSQTVNGGTGSSPEDPQNPENTEDPPAEHSTDENTQGTEAKNDQFVPNSDKPEERVYFMPVVRDPSWGDGEVLDIRVTRLDFIAGQFPLNLTNIKFIFGNELNISESVRGRLFISLTPDGPISENGLLLSREITLRSDSLHFNVIDVSDANLVINSPVPLYIGIGVYNSVNSYGSSSVNSSVGNGFPDPSTESKSSRIITVDGHSISDAPIPAGINWVIRAEGILAPVTNPDPATDPSTDPTDSPTDDQDDSDDDDQTNPHSKHRGCHDDKNGHGKHKHRGWCHAKCKKND